MKQGKRWNKMRQRRRRRRLQLTNVPDGSVGRLFLRRDMPRWMLMRDALVSLFVLLKMQMVSESLQLFKDLVQWDLNLRCTGSWYYLERRKQATCRSVKRDLAQDQQRAIMGNSRHHHLSVNNYLCANK